MTPSGAAILKYLCARTSAPRDTTPVVMSATGNGFGTKTLPGISNVLRCMAFSRGGAALEEEISVASFEIDDQTAEDPSGGAGPRPPGARRLEVFQAPVFGKKGRMSTQVQILARLEHIDAIAQLCFAETSTLGLRLARVSRKLLPRSMVSTDTPTLRVKLAKRPSGQVSAKAEMDDLAVLPGGKAARDQARRTAQRKATGGRNHEPRINRRRSRNASRLRSRCRSGERRHRQPDACDHRRPRALRRRHVPCHFPPCRPRRLIACATLPRAKAGACNSSMPRNLTATNMFLN